MPIGLMTTTSELYASLGSAVTTNNLVVDVSYGDLGSNSYDLKQQKATITGTTRVKILDAPSSASYKHNLRNVECVNVDTVAATLHIERNEGGTYTTLVKVTLSVGDMLGLGDDGWYVMDSTGARKGVGPTGATGATGATGPQGPEGGTTTLTTKGDILTRDASALARLPVGTNGQYLAADSAETTGLKWTTPPTGAPAGAQYVTIALDAGLSAERVLTAGTGISITDGGANGNVTIAASGLATNTPQYVTLAATADLTNERVLTAGTGITLTDAGAGSTLTIAATGAGSAPDSAQYVTLATNATLTNERVLTAGSGISITDAGAGSTVTIATSGMATNTPQYLTLAATADLANERVFTAGTGISVADAGAGSTYTVSVNQGALTHNNLGGLTTGDPHTQYLLESTATTAGDTLYATAASTITRLGIGSNGQVLTVASGLPSWSTPATVITDHGALTGLGDDDHTQYLLKSTVTTSGDLLYGTGSAAITRLGIGSTGQVLTVSGGVPTWAAATGGVTDHGALTGLADDDHTKYIFVDPASSTRNVIVPGGDFKALVVKGSTSQTANLIEGQLNAGTVRFAVAASGAVTGYGFDSSNRAITQVADPTNAQDAATKAYADTKVAASTLTTKGDLLGRDATSVSRVPVGTDGYFLKADSANANGVSWATATFSSALTTKGDILVRDASADTRLAVGTNGYILSANSATSTGLEWIANSGGGGGTSAPDWMFFNAGIF